MLTIAGVVRYIGRLEPDLLGQIFIGVHLVMPGKFSMTLLPDSKVYSYLFVMWTVGTCDGSLRGRQYFQCPPLHGVFVKPADVLCVTGRKVRVWLWC